MSPARSGPFAPRREGLEPPELVRESSRTIADSRCHTSFVLAWVMSWTFPTLAAACGLSPHWSLSRESSRNGDGGDASSAAE